MKKLSKEILNKNITYIDALQEAITEWKNASTIEAKRDYIIAIGEIGNQLHKRNKAIL